jgi:hypothetical protein
MYHVADCYCMYRKLGHYAQIQDGCHIFTNNPVVGIIKKDDGDIILKFQQSLFVCLFLTGLNF